jgi:DNA-binding Lrp family transcriptional regulator
MADWWTELESEILNCLEHVGTVTPAEIGRRLGIPEAATTSLLSLLVRDGKVRIRLVELARREAGASPETNASPLRRGPA